MSLPKPNFNHMLQLIDEVFATRNDPDQIHVNQDQLKNYKPYIPLLCQSYLMKMARWYGY